MAVHCGQRELEVTIHDNGQGVVAQTPGNGFGLTGLAERMRILGGGCTIHSLQGQGTTITVKLSLPEGTLENGKGGMT